MSRCQVCGGSLAGKRADATFCGSACRQRAYRIRNGQDRDVVTSAVVGRNAILIPKVTKLYLKPGMVVADVTYGKGVFWRKVNTGLYDFRPTDISPVDGSVQEADLAALPYADSEIDVLVLDPPYLTNQGKALDGYESNYAVGERLAANSPEDVIDLYRRGMKEADRVVRSGGLVWVKCQDGIVWGGQNWNHITIFGIAEDLGWAAEDLFVLVSNWRPMKWPYQRHARKNHSYLWVFEMSG